MDRTNIEAGVRIVGDDFDIQEISEMLQMCPTESWKKGDRIRKTEHTYSHTAWIYDVDRIETLDIGEQSKKIQELFSDKAEQIAFLKRKHDLVVSIDFAIRIEDASPPAIYFDASFIAFAAKIGAVLDLDTYVN